ncbi:MAG: magnesium transporter CorA family protein [Candidatus Baltobacteraceae bacterium]
MSVSSRCLVYTGHRKSARVLTDLNEISEVLKDPTAFIWYDVVAPQPDDVAVVQEEFDLHPLAIEDALTLHQRSKIDTYEAYWFLIVHGVLHAGDVISVREMAVFAGPRFFITVRDNPAYPIDEIQRRWEHQPESLDCSSGTLLYAFLDTLVDGYWPAAEALEERVAELEGMLFAEKNRARDALIEIFNMKKVIQRFRKAVVPMREILISVLRNDLGLLAEGEVPYFRDIYDHATRVIEEIDAARDLVNSSLEIHLGLTANQQNEVAKSLTIIATIFLPLSYLTGFFGQNFGFLINGIINPRAFWIFGVGLELAALAILLSYFRRKRWL